METNIRLRTFEGIMRNDSEILKEDLINTKVIQNITRRYLMDLTMFDITYYKNKVKFLPFRRCLPFKNEALAMTQIIIWNKVTCDRIFKDLVVGFGKYQNILREFELLKDLKKKPSSYIYLSCLVFFDIIIQSNDDKMLFLMKEDNIMEYLENLIFNNPKRYQSYEKYFPNMIKYFDTAIDVLDPETM